jgi:CRP-like cAMP-binding protein
VPVLSGLTKLQLREFMLDSKVLVPAPGEVIFKRNDYSTTFFSILSGEVNLQLNPNDPAQTLSLRQGQFFGEMGLISGRRRTVTALAGQGCALIETPRRSMNKLISSVQSVRQTIDEVFLLRAIQSQIAPGSTAEELAEVVRTSKIQRFAPGELVFSEGDPGDSLHLVRVGSVTVARNIGGKEIVFAYVPAGKYVGEMALLAEGARTATVRATVATETIRLEGAVFKQLLLRAPELRRRLRKQFESRAKVSTQVAERPESGSVLSFLIAQGLGEATDVLLIDESLCVRCDNCEKACGETHGGVSRLNREAGPTYAQIHVPTSCRHCEHPHCMKDCPPDAIHRAPNGEVYIADNCIGCGNCQRNCPYGVIQMGVVGKPKQSVLWWLLTGMGLAPGEEWHPEKPKNGEPLLKKAVKCDMCKDLAGGPACVRACPTGAALRVSPEKFMSLAR